MDGMNVHALLTAQPQKKTEKEKIEQRIENMDRIIKAEYYS